MHSRERGACTSGTGGNQNNAPIFQRDGAAFLRRIASPHVGYRVPLAW
jgi:hypothetical protein